MPIRPLFNRAEDTFMKCILTMTHNFAELICVVGREDELTLLQTTEDSLIERIFSSWGRISFLLLLTSIPVASLYRPTKTQRIQTITSN